MNLFKKNKNEKTIEEVQEEYFEKIRKIHEDELNSDKYTSIYKFMVDNYWNRKNQKLEEELFKIVGTYGIEDDILNMPNDYKKDARLKRYAKLKNFLDSLSGEQIGSNIFLKSAYIFMKTSIDDCSNILNKLNEIIDNGNETGSITFESNIPDTTKLHIPDYIQTGTAINYYRPEEYKMEYINLLDNSHKYVYEDYTELVRNIGKIMEDIYFLQLNNITNVISNDLMCCNFQVYHPGDNDCFISSFFVNDKLNSKETNKLEMFEEAKRVLEMVKEKKINESISDISEDITRLEQDIEYIDNKLLQIKK